MEPMPPQEALNARPGQQLHSSAAAQDLVELLQRQQAMLLQRFDQQDAVLQSLAQVWMSIGYRAERLEIVREVLLNYMILLQMQSIRCLLS